MTITTEAFLAVSVGASANDGTGDSLRAAFVKVNQNFANIENIGFDAANINVSGSLVLANVYVPTLANSTGTAGQVAYDNNHVYICIATDTWKRANLAAW
jgi:hypothetical protein